MKDRAEPPGVNQPARVGNRGHAPVVVPDQRRHAARGFGHRHVGGRASVRRRSVGRAHDEITRYEDAWRSSAIGRDLYRVATPSRSGRNSARSPVSRSAVSTCGPTHSGFRCSARLGMASRITPTLKPASNARRLPTRSRTADHLRPAILGVSLQHQSRGRSAAASGVDDMGLQKSSEHDVFAGPSARYCPAGVYEWVEEARHAEIRDQRAELRPLQNLRHQGPESKYQLGSTRGRRRTELPEYVMCGAVAAHDAAISGLSALPTARRLFLRGSQKGHCARHNPRHPRMRRLPYGVSS